jgi:pSer/pThr/pTyr-binding forkhead associated (FHA) protein
VTSAKLALSLPEGLLQEYTLSKATVSIGRATTSDIVLLDPTVSRAHARIERTPLGYEVVEMGSANGIRVNGVARSRAVLSPGDVLTLGSSTLRFDTVPDEPDPDATRAFTGDDVEATVIGAQLPTNLPESGLPRFAVHTAAKTWEALLEGDRLTIGRDPGSDVFLDHPAVSRSHAVVERRGDSFAVRDLQSRNGTWLGRQRVSRATLADSDTLRIGPARLVFKRGIADDDLTMTGVGAAWAARRPVIVIPGFAGSALWLGRERVWPTMRMLDIPDLLRMDRPLEARGIVEDVVVVPNLIRLDQYSHLTNYLRESLGYETGKDLLEFGYDFRQDNRESARRLSAAIEAWGVTAPITIIAHSMGCLVARYYVERLGGAGKVERVILLGGPHAGTPYAFASLFRGPNLLPLGVMNVRLREVLTTFPSWYQILPTYRCVSEKESSFDVLGEESWVLESNRPNLRRAREFRKELGTKSSAPAVCIFGYGFKTITGAVVERDPAGGLRKADMVVTANGDGTIPESSAVMRGAEIHPVRQHHGSLYVDNDVKMRLKLELTRDAALRPL